MPSIPTVTHTMRSGPQWVCSRANRSRTTRPRSTTRRGADDPAETETETETETGDGDGDGDEAYADTGEFDDERVASDGDLIDPFDDQRFDEPDTFGFDDPVRPDDPGPGEFGDGWDDVI